MPEAATGTANPAALPPTDAARLLTSEAQGRNILIYASLISLTYLAAPVLYVGLWNLVYEV